jgi:DNA-3-methyladenine glycosylase
MDYSISALELAPLLLGKKLTHNTDSGKIELLITETECYHQDDEASHTYKGENSRNYPMFLDGGHIYVYRSYGIHLCINISAGHKGIGEGVLIRSGIITSGLELAQKNRGKVLPTDVIAHGPGNLAKALGVSINDNGMKIGAGEYEIINGIAIKPEQIIITPRIGISKAKEKLWRFYLDKHTITL